MRIVNSLLLLHNIAVLKSMEFRHVVVVQPHSVSSPVQIHTFTWYFKRVYQALFIAVNACFTSFRTELHHVEASYDSHQYGDGYVLLISFDSLIFT